VLAKDAGVTRSGGILENFDRQASWDPNAVRSSSVSAVPFARTFATGLGSRWLASDDFQQHAAGVAHELAVRRQSAGGPLLAGHTLFALTYSVRSWLTATTMLGKFSLSVTVEAVPRSTS